MRGYDTSDGRRGLVSVATATVVLLGERRFQLRARVKYS